MLVQILSIILILGGHNLQFSYQAGSGPLSVRVETSDKLNDDQWHSVVIERNRFVFCANLNWSNAFVLKFK